MALDLTTFNTFATTVFNTFTLAFTNGLGTDILTEIGAITGAVAAKGADPVSDLAAINALNKVVNDLITAKNQVTASQAS